MGELDVATLLRRHSELEAEFGDGDDGNFLSGWQCANPWADTIEQLVAQERESLSAASYQSLDLDELLERRLAEFHRDVDCVAPEAFFCTGGGTALLFTICSWLRQRDITSVIYLPPLYFTVHFALRLLGIRGRAVSGRQAFDDGFTMNLPQTSSVLFLSDPVWYAGIPIERDVIDRIACWQRETKSLVVVDGSFQYMQWDGIAAEATVRLDPALTLRVICPTKRLAIHGYRFAYATVPKALRTELVQLYARIYGSDSTETVAFARLALNYRTTSKIVSNITGLCSERHLDLRRRGAIEAAWEPRCGYFIFERILAPLPPELILMDGAYFEQLRHTDHRRINLLSPSIGLLN